MFPPYQWGKEVQAESDPHLFQDKIEATLERAKRAVAGAQKRVQDSKVLTERARQTVEECKNKRRA